MDRTKRALQGAVIAAILGLADALYVKPYGSYIPRTTIGLVAAYMFFMLPWAAIGALIGAATYRKPRPPQSN
jgi:hypothetical protein